MSSRDMIMFGEDWGGHPTSTQHLAARFAEEWRILWINSIGLRRPRLNARDLQRVARKLTAVAAPSAPIERAPVPANMTTLSPMALPLPGLGPQMAVNRAALGRQVRGKMSALGMEKPILWTSLPTALPVVGHLGERAAVYYCCDDFGALEGVDHAPVLAMERELAKKCDLIFVSNMVLAERFDPSRTVYLPHGADISLFATPAPRADDLPTDGPVAGFYGSFADWLDKALLRKAALALPQWRFVFIGDKKTDASMLEDLPNVRFLGRRPHAELARYAQHWTASLIPFLPTPQIIASNPLKLREYLAAGSPIVATPFPALDPYRDHIAVAEDADAFIEALRQAEQAAGDAGARSARSASVASETWEARAADALRAVEGL
ncbi:MAG: glycosyltransferase [Neomegalonema sp.]|nr:glycosyltransferase [Neomegalonema sp.]